jgi:hypothetical protein
MIRSVDLQFRDVKGEFDIVASSSLIDVLQT